MSVEKEGFETRLGRKTMKWTSKGMTKTRTSLYNEYKDENRKGHRRAQANGGNEVKNELIEHWSRKWI